MQKLISTFLFFFLTAMGGLAGQSTIGVLSNSNGAFEGYTLYSPIPYTSSYLIDNCGRVINQWDTNYIAGLVAYLSTDGKLIRASRSPMHGFTAVGTGGVLQILNWDGSLDWEAVVSDERFGAHHDIEPTSYGTILLLRWERKTEAEYIQAGKNPDRIPADLWMPSVVEIRPTDMGEFDVIWEWSLFDHLVQSFDPTKDNFGVPSENPRKVDINYEDLTYSDWAHCNSLTLNEDRDELVLNSRNFDEVWILDHSTTSEEAASDTGGNQGVGGQLLARFGNQNTYLENEVEQIFDGQHDAKLFMDADDKLILQVFNNNVDSPKESEIVEVKPGLDEFGRYLLTDNRFEIEEKTFVLESNENLDFNSRIMSSVQTLPNGNRLINSGNEAKFFEITPEGELVWHYVGPVSFNGPNEQGTNMTGSNFKLKRYPLDDPIFDGLDTSVKAESIEINPNLINCGLVSSSQVLDSRVKVYPTVFDQQITLDSDIDSYMIVECYDFMGNKIIRKALNRNLQIDTSTWPAGIYFMSVRQNESAITFKLVKTK